jgi:predicted N-acetyltransferase YhbS
MGVEIRGARAEEMPEVLEMIPRVMGAPREYFAAAYRNDPWARPEHSRIVRVDGEIVSHIRLYDRWQRVGPIPVHVGCVGDVCTLPEHRKQGYCRALLEDALRYWDAHGYDLSMIVSGVGVYAACGWVPLREIGFEVPADGAGGVRREAPGRSDGASDVKDEANSPGAHASHLTPHAYAVRRFVRSEDLTAVAAVYAAYNGERSLTTVRPGAYWERHFSWIAGEIEEMFLVAERGEQIVGYVRCEGGGQRLTVSECCHLPGHEGAAVALWDGVLRYAAKRRIGAVQGHLPVDHPALSVARPVPGFAVTESQLLLFRLVNLPRLLERLRPLLAERARTAGVEAEFVLAVGDQAAEVCVRPGWVGVDGVDEGSTRRHGDTERDGKGMGGSRPQSASSPAVLPEPSSPPCLRASVLSPCQIELEPGVFFGLLFGAVEPGEALAGVAEGPARALAALFPRGAPVYWRTDVV